RLDQRLTRGGDRFGIVPVDLGLGEGTVPQRVEHDRRDLVLLAIARRLPGMEVVDIADQQIGALRPHRVDPQPMGEVHHVDRPESADPAANAGGVLALAVALNAYRVRLVEGRPVLYAVAEP